MKHPFQEPRFTLVGSLQMVTAAASESIESDVRLKRDIEPYDTVLPRLKEISSPIATNPSFQEPRITLAGSLQRVTAAASLPGFSDARLKKDVEPYDAVLPRLKKL